MRWLLALVCGAVLALTWRVRRHQVELDLMENRLRRVMADVLAEGLVPRGTP